MNHNMSIYKSDWKEAKQRMSDWWDGKKVDRAIAKGYAPVEPQDTPRRSKLILDLPDKYTQPEAVFNNVEYGFERTFFGGEAFPCHFVYLGPMFSLACLGCKPNFTQGTTWYESPYKSLDDLAKNFKFDKNNHWWQLLKEITYRSAKRSDGRYLTTLTNFTSIIDVIAGLIGEENLFLAMIEEPEKLKAVRDKIACLGKETFDEMSEIISPFSDGYIDWMQVWSNKKSRTNQCDSCVMISPEMFHDFVLDDLESTYEYIDNAIYHLDGEEQIRHLDILLSIEKIKVIQWVPSVKVNQPEYRDPMNWLELFKRIQDGGKSVLITTPPERVNELLQKVDPSKVILNIKCPDMKSANKTLVELDKRGV